MCHRILCVRICIRQQIAFSETIDGIITRACRIGCCLDITKYVCSSNTLHFKKPISSEIYDIQMPKKHFHSVRPVTVRFSTSYLLLLFYYFTTNRCYLFHSFIIFRCSTFPTDDNSNPSDHRNSHNNSCLLLGYQSQRETKRVV